MISWADFEKLEIHTGTILSAEQLQNARKPAYKLNIDFGLLGIKKSSAQITQHYNPESLIGKQIIAVTNFPPKQIGSFISECLVLGVYGEDGSVLLLTTDKTTGNGLKVG